MAELLPALSSIHLVLLRNAKSRRNRSDHQAAHLKKEVTSYITLYRRYKGLHASVYFTTATGQKVKLLTGLPDALWRRQGVTEDALMPEASKTMDHLSSTVQDHTLHLIFTVV